MHIRSPLVNFIKKLVPKFLIPTFLLEEPFFYIKDKTIKHLHNKFAGKRCFIVGNGPSLNLMNLKKLENEYSFAVNGIFYKTQEMGYRPSFYTVEDIDVFYDNLEEIDEYPIKYKFFPTDYRSKLTNLTGCYFFNMNRGFYEKRSKNFSKPRFSKDFSQRVYCGQSVTIINLQIAYYLGFKEVYLIGMDFSYEIPDSAIVSGDNITSTEDDVNHFHPDYFGKGKKWHDPHLDRVLKSYIHCKGIYEKSNRKIFNATKGGKLEVFERVSYDELF